MCIRDRVKESGTKKKVYGVDYVFSKENRARLEKAGVKLFECNLLDREAVANHHRLHFRGPNLVAAVAGDIESHNPADLLAESLGQLPGGEPWTAPASSTHGDTTSEATLPKHQAAIAIAFPTGPAAAAEHPALELLHHHCADMAGPLFTRIREELGLAYHVSAMRIPGFDAGTLVFFLATSPDQAELAENALREEIAKLAEHGLDEKALESCRNNTLSALALAAQSPGAMARAAAIDTILGLGPDHPQRYPDLLRQVTADELRTVAARILSAQPAIARVNCTK